MKVNLDCPETTIRFDELLAGEGFKFSDRIYFKLARESYRGGYNSVCVITSSSQPVPYASTFANDAPVIRKKFDVSF